MATRRRWTNEENNILVQAITANPHNIKEACRHAATKLEGRTIVACSTHWYRESSSMNNTTKLGVSFMTVGSKTIYKNRKNNSENSKIKPQSFTLWSKIKNFLRLK